MSFADEIAIRTMWAEARGEPDEGLSAVAHVILNRAKDGRWGSNVATVCLWPMQFSSWNASDPNRMKILTLLDDSPDLARCQALYEAARGQPDPTDGACFYYADSLLRPPSWASAMNETARIGHHHFLKDK